MRCEVVPGFVEVEGAILLSAPVFWPALGVREKTGRRATLMTGSHTPSGQHHDVEARGCAALGPGASVVGRAGPTRGAGGLGR